MSEHRHSGPFVVHFKNGRIWRVKRGVFDHERGGIRFVVNGKQHLHSYDDMKDIRFPNSGLIWVNSQG